MPYPVYDQYNPYGQSQPPPSQPYPGYGAYPGYNQPYVAPGPPQYPAYNQPPPGGYPGYPPQHSNFPPSGYTPSGYPPSGYPPSGYPPPGYWSQGPPPVQRNPLPSPEPGDDLVDPDKLLCPVPPCHGRTFNKPSHVKDHWFKIHEQHPVIVYYCAKCSWSIDDKLQLSYHYQDMHHMGDKEVEAVVGRSRSKRYEFNTRFIDPGRFKLKSTSYDYDDRKEKSPDFKSSGKSKSVKDGPGYIYFDAADLVCRVIDCHGKLFNNSEAVIDHWYKVHKQHPVLEYYCSECSYSIDDAKLLKYHYKGEHRIVDQAKVMKSKSKSYSFNGRYINPGKFRLRGEDTDSRDILTPPGINRKTTQQAIKRRLSSKQSSVIYVDPDSCKCPVSTCRGKQFQKSGHFIHHWYRRHHQHGVRNYFCDRCTLKSVDKEFINYHLSTVHHVNWRNVTIHFKTCKQNICYIDPGMYRMKREDLESVLVHLKRAEEDTIHLVKELNQGANFSRVPAENKIINHGGHDGYKCPVSTCSTETFCTYTKLEKHWAETHENKKEIHKGKSSFLYFTEGAGSFENPYRCQQAIIGNSLLGTFADHVPSETAGYIDPGEHKLDKHKCKVFTKKEQEKMVKQMPKHDKKSSRTEKEKQIEKESRDDREKYKKERPERRETRKRPRLETCKCPIPACGRKVNTFASEALLQNHWEKVHQTQFSVKYFCSSCPKSMESSIELAHHLKNEHKFEENAVDYYIDNAFITKVRVNSATYVDPGTRKLQGIQRKVVKFENFIQMVDAMVKNEQKRKLEGTGETKMEPNTDEKGNVESNSDNLATTMKTKVKNLEEKDVKMEVATGAEGEDIKEGQVDDQKHIKLDEQKDVKVNDQTDIKVETETVKLEIRDEECDARSLKGEAAEENTPSVKLEIVKEDGEAVKMETINVEIDTHAAKVEDGTTEAMQGEAGNEVGDGKVVKVEADDEVGDAEAVKLEAEGEVGEVESMKVEAKDEIDNVEAVKGETGGEMGDAEAVKVEAKDEVDDVEAVKVEAGDEVGDAEVVKLKAGDKVGDVESMKVEARDDLGDAERVKEEADDGIGNAEANKGEAVDEVADAEAMKEGAVDKVDDAEAMKVEAGDEVCYTETVKEEDEHNVGDAETVKEEDEDKMGDAETVKEKAGDKVNDGVTVKEEAGDKVSDGVTVKEKARNEVGDGETVKEKTHDGVVDAEAVKAKSEDENVDMEVENGEGENADEQDKKEEEMEVSPVVMNKAEMTESKEKEDKTRTGSGDIEVQQEADTTLEANTEQEMKKLELDSKADKNKSTKFVVLIRGLPGAGKSYIANLLKVQRKYFAFVLSILVIFGFLNLLSILQKTEFLYDH